MQPGYVFSERWRALGSFCYCCESLHVVVESAATFSFGVDRCFQGSDLRRMWDSVLLGG